MKYFIAYGVVFSIAFLITYIIFQKSKHITNIFDIDFESEALTAAILISLCWPITLWFFVPFVIAVFVMDRVNSK